jgi:hypothetical protein
MELGQVTETGSGFRIRRTLSRFQGRVILCVAIVLVVVATALALIPGPSSGPVGPGFPILDSRLGGILIDYAIVTSAFLIAFGASAWSQGFRWLILSATIILGAGVVVEVLAFVLSIPVSSGSVTFYVQPYPQSWFPLVYGVLLFLFAPACWLLQRQARRATLHVEAPRPL